MEQRRRRAGSLFAALVLVAALALSFAVRCRADAPAVVRVGVFSLGRYMGFDEKGNAIGYEIDYLNELAKLTHQSYEYIDCGNWENVKEKLRRGEIDMAGPAQRTERLTGEFGFTTLSLGIEATGIYTTTDRSELAFEDFAAMKRLRVGVPAGTQFEKDFKNLYTPAHGLENTITGYANTTELLAALMAHEQDAIVTNIMFASDDLKLLGWFSPKPIYFITRPENTALLDTLDAAMTSLLVSDPDCVAQLESHYFPLFKNTNLTYEEQQFAASLPTITVGYEVNHAPLSDIDAETGEFTGITRDILDRVSELSGIRFCYEALPATDVSFDYLREHEIYVLSNVEYNEVNRSIPQMHLSLPYLESEKVLVASTKLQFDTESPLHIALATGSNTLPKVITAQYPNFTCEAYATVEECFDAILDGTVDATIQNRYVADSRLENPRYTSLKVLPIQLLSDELTICAIETDDSALCAKLNSEIFLSIMDKSIGHITSDERNSILIENTSNARYRLTFWDFVTEYRYTLVAVIVLVGVCIVLLWRNQKLTAAKNRALAAKNRQLADAVAQADRASVAKSQFLSRMSHEIRTPMNAIVGLTTIARRHSSDAEKVEEYLTKIETSSKVLLTIINDILDMSAIESNKLKISSAAFDLKQVLNGISTIYYPQCDAKGVSFRMETSLENERLIGDSLRVNQILLNLVSNAYKFTPAGGVIQITVEQTARRDNTAFVRFTVSDTGCGMTPEMRERLFKPFEQESADTAQKHGGSGLGLSIAKNLVDLMHGAIGVQSEKDKGTTFTVDLPFGIAAPAANGDAQTPVADACAQTPPALSADTPENCDFTGHRVLLAEDNDLNAEIAGELLSMVNLAHDRAENGQQALDLFAAAAPGTYDAILMDVQMPVMDGYAATRALRALPRPDAKTVPILAMTANAFTEDVAEALSAGMNGHIAKPIDTTALYSTLAKTMGLGG